MELEGARRVSTDSGGLRDDVRVELNPDPDPVSGEAPSSLRRPAESANKRAWLDYAVDLGADRAFLEGTSRHWSDDVTDYVSADALTREQLIDLADRLDG